MSARAITISQSMESSSKRRRLVASRDEGDDNNNNNNNGDYPEAEMEQQLAYNNMGEDSTELSENDGSDMEVDRIAFMKQYAALTKAAKRLGTNLDMSEDFQGGSILVLDNIEDGEKLASQIGCDPSKASSALHHALAIAKTTGVSVRKCGNTSSIFSIEKYTDVLIALSSNGNDDEYDPDKAHEILSRDAVKSCCEGYSLSTIHGAVTFSNDAVVVSNQPKKRKLGTRANFDNSIPPTQHQVINSKVLKSQGGDPEKESVLNSLRQGQELSKRCQELHQEALPLYKYATDGTKDPQNFIKKVFDAAVMTRDGCAEVSGPVENSSSTEVPGTELLLKAAKPPSIADSKFEINRSQHILSFNSQSIRTLLKRKK